MLTKIVARPLGIAGVGAGELPDLQGRQVVDRSEGIWYQRGAEIA
jgi:hypothetical protein